MSEAGHVFDFFKSHMLNDILSVLNVITYNEACVYCNFHFCYTLIFYTEKTIRMNKIDF